VGAVQNPFNWYALENIEMSYSGQVYAKGDANSMQLWNLVNGRIPALANSVAVVAGATPTVTTVAAPAWSVLQFGQAYDPITAHSMYVAGVPILNGIVNLKFTIPKLSPTGGTPPSGAGITYTLHTTYVYNGVLSLSQGSCGLVL
jgi:hypothetical protein